MAAFDQLPKVVRAALTASPFNRDVEQILATYREKRMTAWQLARHIRIDDDWRARGPPHLRPAAAMGVNRRP